LARSVDRVENMFPELEHIGEDQASPAMSVSVDPGIETSDVEKELASPLQNSRVSQDVYWRYVRADARSFLESDIQ
jgi:hypothetical protein